MEESQRVPAVKPKVGKLPVVDGRASDRPVSKKTMVEDTLDEGP
jgi:hypothetical protein